MFEGGICHYNIIKPSLEQGGGFLLENKEYENSSG